jgi:hypothetical protein
MVETGNIDTLAYIYTTTHFFGIGPCTWIQNMAGLN